MENQFELVSEYKPSGDQPEAIRELVSGLKEDKKFQVLLGATGTGKTFTISNVIAQVNRPTLVFAHNKTLAGQLYSEFKEFFPHNRVEYFVSYFDYYQPEAYLPKTDTYIDKNTKTNEELDMLRMAAVNSVLERRDTIIVASVASIYGASNPEQYRHMIFTLRSGQIIERNELMLALVHQQYKRNDTDPLRGTFRVRGDVIEITPGHTDRYLIRIEMFDDEVERICEVDPVTGHVNQSYQLYIIYPANGYATSMDIINHAADTIQEELDERLAYFDEQGKPLEKERLEQRCRYDIEALREFGVCPGIENYSRHIDGRKPGERPYTLFDYFPDDFLLVVDEIKERIEKHERTLITTLTVRMAEDLTSYLKNMDLKVAWLHHEVTTIERTEIIHDLRQGKYDVLVGINLLREGLDIPEVSLIAILDADKEGFLRSRRSLIQIIGRAARNAKGKVIMYADKITESMQEAIDETARRRSIQMEYNEKHGIVPKTIIKPIHDVVRSKETKEMAAKYLKKKKLPAKQKEKMIKELEQEMKEAARTLDFERAAQLRDILFEMKGEK